jgi:hypothetical protein
VHAGPSNLGELPCRHRAPPEPSPPGPNVAPVDAVASIDVATPRANQGSPPRGDLLLCRRPHETRSVTHELRPRHGTPAVAPRRRDPRRRRARCWGGECGPSQGHVSRSLA